MQKVKYCQRCGEPISDIYHNSYHSHIALRYCPECRKIARSESVRQAKTKYRKRKMRDRLQAKWSEDADLNTIKVLDGQLTKTLKELLTLTEQKCDILQKELMQERAKNRTENNVGVANEEKE